MPSVQQQFNYSLDLAIQALEEVFPGHPLIPAVKQSYLSGVLWHEINDSSIVGSPTQLWKQRIRDIGTNSELFWKMFLGYFARMSLSDYIAWVRWLCQWFKSPILATAERDKNTMQIVERLKLALIRDYRFFKDGDKARKLEDVDMSDSRRPEEEIFRYIQLFTETINPRGTPPEGYEISNRLCARHNPLLLKLLAELVKGTGRILHDSGQRGNIPTRFRLFYDNKEVVEEYDNLLIQNIDGVELNQKEGGTMGNKWLESRHGRAMLGAIAQLLIDGGGKHSLDAANLCQAFFWQDYDGHFANFLREMIDHDSKGVGAHPHLRIIANTPNHFFNTGHFRVPHNLTSYMFPLMSHVNHEIGTWADKNVLEKAVLDVLSEKRVGSGSGTQNPDSLAEKLHKKWTAKQPLQQIPLEHTAEMEGAAFKEWVKNNPWAAGGSEQIREVV